MKNKNLFLSLCFGGLAVLFLAIFAIVSIIPPKNNPENPSGNEITAAVNEGNNKGSAEDPYYIYDTETFVNLLSTYGGKTKPVRTKVQEIVQVEKKDENGNVVMGENGEPVMENKTDEEGNPVYQDKLDENNHVVYMDDPNGATEVYHFKFLTDVDFSGKDFVPLFNKGAEAEEGQGHFIGIIDGDGKVVKNITISVNKDNLSNYIHKSSESANEYSAYVAIFGMTKGTSEENAVISNISFDNISVNVDDALIPYLRGNGENINDNFGNDFGGSFKEFVIGSVVAYAENTTIKANVKANINSDAYAVYEGNKVVGINAVGGVVGFSHYLTMEDSKVNVGFISDSGNGGYYLGGISGYLYESSLKNIEIEMTVKAISAINENYLIDMNDGTGRKENINAIYIGGVSGNMRASSIDKANIKLNVSQTENDRINMAEETTINNYLYNKVAGISAFVRADNSNQITSISNVNVKSDVNMDCIFSGAIYEVRTEDTTSLSAYVNLKNIVLDSNVNVIMASGVGEMLFHTKLEYDEECVYGDYNGNEFNVKLTGVTSYKTHSLTQQEKAVTPVVKYKTNDASFFKKSDIKLVYSNSLEIPFTLLTGFTNPIAV